MQQIISSCILDWQVYRLADNDPFPCRSVSLFRLSTLTYLTMSALVLLNLFHSIMFPTIHRGTFKSICSSADVTDFRAPPGARRASR
jgi:fucose permease